MECNAGRKEITFSIITVCYNSEKTIKYVMESVLSQTYDNYELIVIDGKSTDDTIKIVERYKKKFGDKLTVVSERDKGIYDAMNKGLLIASGDLVCFLNSDDWFEKDALENVLKARDNNRYQVIYGMQRTITNNMEENCVIYSHNFISKKMLCHQALFSTKAIFDDYGVFDLKYKSAADYDWLINISKKQNVVFTPIYNIVVNFRSGGMSESKAAMREMAKIQYKNGFIKMSRVLYLYAKSFFV